MHVCVRLLQSAHVDFEPNSFCKHVCVCVRVRLLQSDPVEFASWLLNALHSDLTGGKVKKQSIITQCFQVCVCQGVWVCMCVYVWVQVWVWVWVWVEVEVSFSEH